MIIRTFFVICQFLEFSLSDSVTGDTGCKHKDNILYCTTIPKDLPENVTHVNLNYSNNHKILKTHKIQQEDFDGKYWENLRFLQITDSSGIQPYAMTNLTNLQELIIKGDRFQYLEPESLAGLIHVKVLRLYGLKELDTISITNALNSLPNLQVLTLTDMVLSDMNLDVLNIPPFRGGRCEKIGRRCMYSKSFPFAYTDRRIYPVYPVHSLSCTRHFKAVSDFVVHLTSKHLKILDMYGNIMNDIAFALIPIAMEHYEKINITFSKFHNLDFILHKEYYTNSLLQKPEGLVSCLANLVSNVKNHRTVRKSNLNTTYHISVFDASYISSPGVEEYITYVLSLHNTSHTIVQDMIPGLSTAEIINITGINGCNRKISLNNLTVNIKSYLGTNSPTRELILRNNHLNYLDVKFKCNESNLEILDLSSNDIEFIQPEMCSCCFRLKEINLSKNLLFKMADTYFTLFRGIFSSYSNLKNLFLSSNQLTMIPVELFNDTIYLELIDLSNNFLTNINFNLNQLKNLKVLDLKSNRISILDAISLTNLNPMLQSNKTQHNVSRIISIYDNPIMCSECDTLYSLKWIATTPQTDHDGSKIICKNYKGNYIPADQNAVKELQEECDKPKRIKKIVILSTMITLATTALTAIFSFIWLRYRRQMLRKKNIEEKIELIQQNQLETRYVVFLSYSSEDMDFLIEYVYNPLKIHLQEKIQTDRDIICLGDKHFQLGKPINDEMVRCLQQSAVILLLVSRNFCKSEFCQMEFDHALFMKKQFILMVKGEIDVNEMVPCLQEIFNRNTRLLWERKGDIFVMKTSWVNVCSSILDLVP